MLPRCRMSSEVYCCEMSGRTEPSGPYILQYMLLSTRLASSLLVTVTGIDTTSEPWFPDAGLLTWSHCQVDWSRFSATTRLSKSTVPGVAWGSSSSSDDVGSSIPSRAQPDSGAARASAPRATDPLSRLRRSSGIPADGDAPLSLRASCITTAPNVSCSCSARRAAIRKFARPGGARQQTRRKLHPTSRGAARKGLVVAAERPPVGPRPRPRLPLKRRAASARSRAWRWARCVLGEGEPLGLPQGHERLGEVLDLAQRAHLVGRHEGKGDARLPHGPYGRCGARSPRGRAARRSSRPSRYRSRRCRGS